MKTSHNHQTAFWLVVSALLLSSLIPGGPVENRDFSHIHPAVLATFNIFLTTLDLGSFVLALFAWKDQRWALRTAFGAAIAYFAVYAVDLAQLFPRSPTPMSLALSLIEVLGMTAAVALMFASKCALGKSGDVATASYSVRTRYSVAAALVLAGVAIIWFATDAAMGETASWSLAGGGVAS